PAGDGQSLTDDRVAAVEAAVLAEQVHRSAATVRGAGLLPEQLGHHRPGIDPLGDRVPMFAIGAVDVVLRAEGRDGAHDGGLLTDVQVAEAADLGQLVHLRGFFLEPPDEEHLAVELEQGGFVGERLLRFAIGWALLYFHCRSWDWGCSIGCEITSIVFIEIIY